MEGLRHLAALPQSGTLSFRTIKTCSWGKRLPAGIWGSRFQSGVLELGRCCPASPSPAGGGVLTAPGMGGVPLAELAQVEDWPGMPEKVETTCKAFRGLVKLHKLEIIRLLMGQSVHWFQREPMKGRGC